MGRVLAIVFLMLFSFAFVQNCEASPPWQNPIDALTNPLDAVSRQMDVMGERLDKAIDKKLSEAKEGFRIGAAWGLKLFAVAGMCYLLGYLVDKETRKLVYILLLVIAVTRVFDWLF
jgi:hypothetical protein